jgi:hypothetical protein
MEADRNLKVVGEDVAVLYRLGESKCPTRCMLATSPSDSSVRTAFDNVHCTVRISTTLTVYVRLCTETQYDWNVISHQRPTVWSKQSEFVSCQQSGQVLQCRKDSSDFNGQNVQGVSKQFGEWYQKTKDKRRYKQINYIGH